MSDKKESAGDAGDTGAATDPGSTTSPYGSVLDDALDNVLEELRKRKANAPDTTAPGLPSVSDHNDADALRNSIFGDQATDANRKSQERGISAGADLMDSKCTTGSTKRPAPSGDDNDAPRKR